MNNTKETKDNAELLLEEVKAIRAELLNLREQLRQFAYEEAQRNRTVYGTDAILPAPFCRSSWVTSRHTASRLFEPDDN